MQLINPRRMQSIARRQRGLRRRELTLTKYPGVYAIPLKKYTAAHFCERGARNPIFPLSV